MHMGDPGIPPGATAIRRRFPFTYLIQATPDQVLSTRTAPRPRCTAWLLILRGPSVPAAVNPVMIPSKDSLILV